MGRNEKYYVKWGNPGSKRLHDHSHAQILACNCYVGMKSRQETRKGSIRGQSRKGALKKRWGEVIKFMY